MPSFGKRIARSAVAAAATVALSAGILTGLGSGSSLASSHREAPLVAADPQVDNTDVYAFVSPDKPGSVTLISNWIPFEEPAGGPNFYSFSPDAHYDINIDNNGDAKPDIILRWDFTNHYRNPDTFLYNTGPVSSLNDANLNFYQTYNLTVLHPGSGASTTPIKDAIVVPSRVGHASMPDYASLFNQGIVNPAAGTSNTKYRSFAGQADDPFFLDLRVFDLLYGGNLSEVGDDTLAGFNINTTAVQVPKSVLAMGHNSAANPIIGVWSTAERQSTRVQNNDGSQNYSGNYVQVSRLGNPLVNEVVVPIKFKDYWNASQPKDDAQFLPAVNDPELPHLINAVYGIPVPDSDPNKPGIQRDDLIAVFLTGVSGLNQPPNVTPSEELRLNMSIPPCEEDTCSNYSPLGVIAGDNAGFPNGRRLGDDVIDIAVRVMEGQLIGNPNSLGDGVNANDKAFDESFPYLALPTSGSDQNTHPVH